MQLGIKPLIHHCLVTDIYFNEQTDGYDVVTSVKERSGVVVIEVAGVERHQSGHVVLHPLPDVTSHVVEPETVRRIHVHRLTQTHGEGGIDSMPSMYRIDVESNFKIGHRDTPRPNRNSTHSSTHSTNQSTSQSIN